MNVLPILRWPDPRLAQPCAEVSGDVAGQAELIRDMFATMYAAPGRGLAGPQVGVMLRLFVIDAGWKTGDKTPRVCINPHILSASEDVCAMDEGCLSVPGVTAGVTRPAEIVLGYTDELGVAQRVALTGAEARIAQHELDHLDGVMHFDRLEPGGRAALLAEYEALP
ncbi:peptide deformylase [Thetidibacter halocola]|uniref:Peptide deformylase n=1 Tax=Thetidibacter halocola TaxID=2827239 RepID=A0A8J7WGS6_9RHOB|nr:peptide deformylase [Thetidibacter halocola]MBS0124828.1 peptide deformylase [Thetidibacter halocola]